MERRYVRTSQDTIIFNALWITDFVVDHHLNEDIVVYLLTYGKQTVWDGESLPVTISLMEFTRSICSRLIVVSWSLTKELGSSDSSSITGGLRRNDCSQQFDRFPFNRPFLDIRFELLLMAYLGSKWIVAWTFWINESPTPWSSRPTRAYLVRSEVSTDWWYSV